MEGQRNRERERERGIQTDIKTMKQSAQTSRERDGWKDGERYIYRERNEESDIHSFTLYNRRVVDTMRSGS